MKTFVENIAFAMLGVAMVVSVVGVFCLLFGVFS